MNQKITKICKEIVRKYENDKNVLGIILFGSALKKDFDEMSDVDFFIITKDKHKALRINTVSENTKVDILFNTIDDLKKFIINERKSTWRNTSYMLAGGKAIFTRTKEIESIIKKAKNNIKLQTNPAKNELLMHKYSINDFYDDVKRSCKANDFISFGIASSHLINNIIELFLKINRLALRKPSELSAIIKATDLKFYRLLVNYYKETNLKERLNATRKLIDYTFKISKGDLPKYWEVKSAK